MMKRLSALLVALLLCFSLFAASAKPSMDGRAVVAEIGELPIGLFAKSAAFLPGDTVVVTNPATRISIEVMIFGGFDSSEGIAIVLSPEAARELYITKGSNVIVQVTKKTDAWSENTILSKTVESYAPESDPDVNQEMMIGDIEEPVFDTPGVMVEDVVFYVEEPILPPEEFVEETLKDMTEAVDDGASEEPAVPETEEPADASVPDLETSDAVSAEIDMDDEISTEPADDPVEVETVEEVTVQRAPLISRGSRVETEAAENTVEDNGVGEDLSENADSTQGDEKWALIADDAEFVSEMYDSDSGVSNGEPEETDEIIEEETGTCAEDDAEEKEEVFDADEIVNPADGEDDTDISVFVEPEDGTEDEESVELESDEDIIVETEVILIPTEFNPPVVVEEKSAESAVSEEIESSEYEDEELIERDDETIDFEYDEESEEILDEDDGLMDEPEVLIFFPEDVEEESEVQEITVISQNELPKGYYVQIMTASRISTVEDVRDLYAAHYPMQYAESSRGGIQVLIGPLTADEYAIIQSRFRSYGYKDCFVRIIK